MGNEKWPGADLRQHNVVFNVHNVHNENISLCVRDNVSLQLKKTSISMICKLFSSQPENVPTRTRIYQDGQAWLF